MIEEYVVGKILEVCDKEGKTERSLVRISVEGREEVSEHFKKYADMFKSGDEVICVWRPEFSKITQMWFPGLWTKIAKQIEPYPTKLVEKTNSKGRTFIKKVRLDKKNRLKEQQKFKPNQKPRVLIMY